MLKKVILLVVLICAVPVLAAAAQSKGLTFVGKIDEIAAKTQMTAIGATERFLTIKLDSKPKLDFRITARDAARFGLTDTSQPSAVLTPGQVNGVGWKVRLTCDKHEQFGGDPIYRVIKLEKLD
jgi:hypothetical protein